MKATTTYFLVLCISVISRIATAETPTPPNSLMCIPGDPNLAQLAADAKAYTDSLKSSDAK